MNDQIPTVIPPVSACITPAVVACISWSFRRSFQSRLSLLLETWIVTVLLLWAWTILAVGGGETLTGMATRPIMQL